MIDINAPGTAALAFIGITWLVLSPMMVNGVLRAIRRNTGQRVLASNISPFELAHLRATAAPQHDPNRLTPAPRPFMVWHDLTPARSDQES